MMKRARNTAPCVGLNSVPCGRAKTTDPHLRTKSQKQPFTLIELLVVITVIAILVSLLMPALSKTREKALAIACTANLKQMAVGITMYPLDDNGYAIPADLQGSIDSWINYIAAEHQMPARSFQCPALSQKDGFNPYGGNGDRYTKVQCANYIMNAIHVKSWGSACLPHALPEDKVSGWSNGTTDAVHSSSLIQPSQKIVIIDAWQGIGLGDARGIISFDETDHGLTGGKRDVGIHHQDGFNVLFGDGHTEHRITTESESWAAARP